MVKLTPEFLIATVDALNEMAKHVNPAVEDYTHIRGAQSYAASILRVSLNQRIPEDAMLVEMPYSEVCCHMGVAGELMWVAPCGNNMAQLFRLDGAQFSMPITDGEAGLRMSGQRRDLRPKFPSPPTGIAEGMTTIIDHEQRK